MRTRPVGTIKVGETTVTWSPSKTAIIVCDMWDDHWCKSAAGARRPRWPAR